jgi:exopolysaccharide biosynthesis polyprenyl glycosylphosphotransferase
VALTLAFLEGVILFAAGCGAIVVWAQPVLVDWLDLATLVGQGLALSLCCITAFYYNDLYDLRIVRSFGEFVSRLLQAFGVSFILLAGFYTVFPDTRIAGGPFVSSLLIVAGLLLPLRAATYAVMRSRPLIDRVLILGTSPLAYRIIAEIEAQPQFRYDVVGVADDPSRQAPPGRPLLGPLDHLPKVIEAVRPDRIVVALAERRGRVPLAQLLEARMRGIVVEDGVAVYEHLTKKLAIESLTPSSLIFAGEFRKSRLDLAVGRAISLLASVLGLVLTAPLLALIAVAIKLDSKGPVLFVQDRVGVGGRRFQLLKFRTMHPTDTETSEWVRDNSDRITRVGKWLRQFRLDELPQFVNIFRGDMNLVGPRPHPVTNLELFRGHIPYYALRLAVRPGVTGWAQIRYGYANNLEEETEKMRYDLYYIKHLSLWFDLRILFDTVKTVLFGRGSKTVDAYAVSAAVEARR